MWVMLEEKKKIMQLQRINEEFILLFQHFNRRCEDFPVEVAVTKGH
jgi:hypothetical protein